MKPLAPRLLAAFLLFSFASAAGAAVLVSPNDPVDAWSESLGRPEGFTRMADGSSARRPIDDEPVSATPASPAGARVHRLSPRLAGDDFRREAPAVPAVADGFQPVPKPLPPPVGLPLAGGLTAAAGVCLALILRGGGAAVEAEPEIAGVVAPAPAPYAATVLPPRVADFLLDAPQSAAPPLAVQVPALDAPFIDTRMPVGTWRAIAAREQTLIDRWDASAEKAAGRASFEQWLDRQGAVPGVDVPLLKAKLARA